MQPAHLVALPYGLLERLGVLDDPDVADWVLRAEPYHWPSAGAVPRLSPHDEGLMRQGHRITARIDELVASRAQARRDKDFATADRMRAELAEQRVLIEDRPDGTSDWRRL
jgi:cysteinyl-tRNA synthetase